jgi:cell wall-associated NlpC family hydrolase
MTSDSPNSFLARASTLSALARHEQALISEMTATEHKQNVAQHAADQALSAQKVATDGAAKAKDTAMKALDNQVSQVALIKQQQADLQAQLAVLKGTARNLAVARADGLRRQAAEAAAARRAAVEAAAAAKRRADQARAELARQAAASGAGRANSTSGATSSGGGDVVPAGSGRSITSAAQRQKAVDFAQGQLGVWYRWAGAGEVGPTVTATGVQSVPGYDCSGLTMRAYQSAGISLGHYTGLQWDEGMHVSRDQLQPGDLVFFATDINDISTIHHVGIYIGGGQMIDAPQTGEQIGVRNAFRSDYIGAVQP